MRLSIHAKAHSTITPATSKFDLPPLEPRMLAPPLAQLAPAVVASPAESPPSVAHLAQIEDARRRVRPIRRAAAVARFNGWTLVGFAGITLLCSVGSFWGIVVGLALAGVGYVELRGGTELRRLDRTAAVRLAWNQLALGLLLITYATVNVYIARYGPSVVADPQLSGGDPQVAQMLAPYDSLTRSITSAVYAVVGLVGAAVPALTAMFYLRRRRLIDEYLQRTPAWIVNLQRMGSTL